MLKTRTLFAATLAVAATLALSSCAAGTSTGTSPSSSAGTESAVFNDADVMFAQMMIPHHEQAVQMSDDLLAKDGIDQRVTDLAEQIKAAQEPEIVQLNGWLTDWDATDMGMSGTDGMDGMDGMGGSDGMMSDDDMMAFENAQGTDADRLFLEQMTVHHEGALTMAQLEIDTGENADAQALAANIVTTQTAEITVMAELLVTL